MRIFILRHEDRTQDCTMFSPLTELGLEKAEKLVEPLDKLNITQIYSSPYIRTLQTVYPYAKKKNLKIKLEYSLVEIQHPNIIPSSSYKVRLPEYIAKEFNFQQDYNSKLQPEELQYPEDESKVDRRLRNFLKDLISKYLETDENILLVTHQTTCWCALKIIKKNKNLHPQYKPSDKSITNYSKGALSLIFNTNSWFFKPINWKE